jgi:transposase
MIPDRSSTLQRAVPAKPRWLKGSRTLGETVCRASLGGGERWRSRAAPGPELILGRRVGGGRATQAFRAGAGALAPALAAWRNERLAVVDPEAGSEVLRLLSERREDLVAERTRTLNRLHGLLRDLVPGGVPGTLSTHRAARIVRGIRPQGASARVRRQLTSEILRDIRTLERKIADLNERIEAEVEVSDASLTEIFGIGPILAAKIISTVGNARRFPTKAHYFASYSGTAPVEASSGEVVRHRLSLAGNRRLNNALHMVAICQTRSDVRGRAYYRKKIVEGKSRKEALRCLKRRICDAVFKSLMADLQEPSCSAA